MLSLQKFNEELICADLFISYKGW